MLQVVSLADHSEDGRVGTSELVFNIRVQALGGEVKLDAVEEGNGLVENIELVFWGRRAHQSA